MYHMKIKNRRLHSLRLEKLTCLTASLTTACILFCAGAAQAQQENAIEAASFNNSAGGVSTQSCSEGGLNVGDIANGSWIEYNQVDMNGVTGFQARVASAGPGGNIEIYLDSPTGTLIGTCPVPVTGGWQTWTTQTIGVSGASGCHNVYLVFTGGSGGLFNVEWFNLQGVVNATEAASYNNENSVQTEVNSEGGGLDVGYISNGSWIEYNQMNLNGVTSFQARVASAGAGGNIEIYLDSPTGTLIGTCPVPVTGGWETWTTQTISVSGVSGCHNVYLVFTGGSGGLFNVEWFDFQGRANEIAADSYNSENSIQIQTCSEGGSNVDYIANGSWVEYNQINLNGVTGFSARVASATAGGSISVCLGSPTGPVIGTLQVPVTGGWQTWTTETIDLNGVTGYTNVYLVFTAGLNLEWFSFNNPGYRTMGDNYNSENSVGTQSCSEGGSNVDDIANGSWIEYNQVNLNGMTTFSARTASSTAGGSISVCVGSPTGPVIGTLQVPVTGGWQNWSTETIPLGGASGYTNVYLVCSAGFNLEWFAFQSGATYGLPMLHASGTQIVNAGGLPVQLTGVNMGSLLVMEAWMCPLDSGGLPDTYSVIQELDSRFGVATEQSMIKCYQTNWITTTDLQNIKNAGFNCIRVPVWWGDFFTLASYGSPSGWRPDAFTELDWLVNNCANYGIYVVIDMHGVVGGQSTSQDCGQQNQNTYWTNSNYQGDTAYMWWEIANHYNGNGTVAGYDLINEPTGTPSTADVWSAYNSLYNSVRSADPSHMIFMEGTFGSWDWSMLPSPSTYGWSNVAYEMHEYEYGGDTAVVEQGSQKQVNDFNNHSSWNVPDYIGEFNDMGNGAACWDYSLNLYNSNGINWTMWAYKATDGLVPDSWGWYDPTYWPTTPNITTSSASAIYSDWQEWQTPAAFGVNSSDGL